MKHFAKLITLLFFLSTNVYAQHCEVRNLVFEGAGIRGIAYAGVIEELENQHKLGSIEKVGGTSAGAITAMMLSLGYTSGEIAAIISSTKFQRFNDGRFMFIGGMMRMKNVYGWYRGEKFTNWLADLIADKTGNSEITFQELHELGYKDLYVTATCLNKQKLLVFSKENYPHMKVKNAVRISMSIPLYFQAVFIDSTGNVYKKPTAAPDLDIVVDGGILGNFPITMFDSVAMGAADKSIRLADTHTLGFRIDSDLQIQQDTASRELAPAEILNFNDYISAFYVLVLENLNRNDLTESDWSRTVSVSSVGISPRIKKLSQEQKEKLVESGRYHTKAYLAKNCVEIKIMFKF